MLNFLKIKKKYPDRFTPLNIALSNFIFIEKDFYKNHSSIIHG